MKKHVTSALSQAFGKFANKEFAKPIQNFINSSYVNIMGLDMREFHDASTYRSLNALFTRKLREPRVYSLDSEDFISPCDSLISECGTLDEEYALQIKGMRYRSDELLG
jgi:phosphatidylserine decarboxylase